MLANVHHFERRRYLAAGTTEQRSGRGGSKKVVEGNGNSNKKTLPIMLDSVKQQR